MAVERISPAKGHPEKKQEKKKLRNALLAILLLAVLISAVGLSLFGIGRLLFVSNPRLVLHEVRVNGSGYWKDHADELSQKIGLASGTNLFSLDLRKIRRDLCRVPNVESASVYRILPDTLIIRVTERVPRAFLNRVNSPLVADGSCVIIPRSQSMRSYARLPVITDVRLRGIEQGVPFKEIAPAMELIMTAVRNYPDITIYRISLRNPKKLDIRLSYGKFPINRLLIPVKNNGMSFMLMAYQSAVINARRIGETRRNYDLSFDGKCVIY